MRVFKSLWASTLLVFMIFSFVSVFWLWPVAANLDKGVPVGFAEKGTPALVPLTPHDSLETLYHMWNFKQGLTKKGMSPIVDNYQCVLNGKPSMIDPWNWPVLLLFIPLSFFGDAAAFNILMLLAIPAAAAAMFLLVEFYTKSKIAAFVGAAVFALAPYIGSKLTVGHTYAFIIFLVPLTIWLVEKTLKTNRILFGVLAGLFSLTVLASDPNMGLYLTMFLAALIPYRLVVKTRAGEDAKTLLKPAAPFAGLYTIGLGYVLWTKMTVLDASFNAGGRAWDNVVLYSPALSDVVNKHWFGYMSWEKNIYFDSFLVVLIAVGLASRLFSKRWPSEVKVSSEEIFYGITFAVTLVLALGAALPIYKFFYSVIPFIKYSRTPGRMIMFTHASLAVLAGYFVAAIRKSPFIEKKYLEPLFIVVVSLMALATAGKYVPPQVRIAELPKESAICDTLKQSVPTTDAILNIPVTRHYSGTEYLYYTMLSGVREVNSVSPLSPKKYLDAIARLEPLNDGKITSGVRDELRAQRVRYIVVYTKFTGTFSQHSLHDILTNLEKSGTLEYVQAEEGRILYKVKQHGEGT